MVNIGAYLSDSKYLENGHCFPSSRHRSGREKKLCVSAFSGFHHNLLLLLPILASPPQPSPVTASFSTSSTSAAIAISVGAGMKCELITTLRQKKTSLVVFVCNFGGLLCLCFFSKIKVKMEGKDVVFVEKFGLLLRSLVGN